MTSDGGSWPVPELPETETIARDLDDAVTGQRIQGVHVSRPDVLREVTPQGLAQRLTGAKIVRCWRRAKLIIIDLSTQEHLLVQPRFTGTLLIDDGSLDQAETKYSAVTLHLADGRRLHYRDIRRLGTVTVMSPDRWERYSAQLGTEPLDPAFTASHLSGIVRGSARMVKKVLMDQRLIAGVGNIYANEALWRAQVDPSRRAGSLGPEEIQSLRDGIVTVLEESIAARGTTFRDFRDARGARGDFASHLAAYGRAGLPCPRCGARMIGTAAIDGRGTVFCAGCQH